MLSTLQILGCGVAAFFAVLGAAFQQSNGGENKAKHTISQQVISFLTAVAVTLLVEALLLFKAEWHFLWVSAVGFCFSLAAEHVVRLVMNYQKGAKSLLEYAARIKKMDDLVRSGKIDLDGLDKDDPKQEDPNQKES